MTDKQRESRVRYLTQAIRYPSSRIGPEARMEDIAELFFWSQPRIDSVRRQVWLAKDKRCDLIFHACLPDNESFWGIVELKATRAGWPAVLQLAEYVAAWRQTIDDTAWVGAGLIAPSYHPEVWREAKEGRLQGHLFLFNAGWMRPFMDDMVSGALDRVIGIVQ